MAENKMYTYAQVKKRHAMIYEESVVGERNQTN